MKRFVMSFSLTYCKDLHANDETCVICMDKQVDCSSTCHIQFCTTCLLQWLKSHNTCPLCRKRIHHVITSHPSYKTLPQKPPIHGLITNGEEVDMILRKLIRQYFPVRQHEVYAQMSTELSKYDANALLAVYYSCTGIIERWCMDYSFADLMLYYQCNRQRVQNMIPVGLMVGDE